MMKTFLPGLGPVPAARPAVASPRERVSIALPCPWLVRPAAGRSAAVNAAGLPLIGCARGGAVPRDAFCMIVSVR